MKQVINGKVYNTETITTLVEVSRHSNGNYCGTDSIRVTPKGLYAFVCSSNGQDLYRKSYIEALTKDEVAERINGWELLDEEQEVLAQHGLIEEA